VKRITAVAFAGVLLFVSVGAASAATTEQRVAKLEKQVKALQSTVKKQQTTITKQTKSIKTLNTLANASFAVDLCLLGVTTDAIQSTWVAIDHALGTTVFGPQQTIGDASACSDLQIARQGIKNPPSVSGFSAIVGLFQGGRHAFRLFDWAH
jgi:hypothetical protein